MRQLGLGRLLHCRPVGPGLEELALDVGLGADPAGGLEAPPRRLGGGRTAPRIEPLSRLLEPGQERFGLPLRHRDLVTLHGELPFQHFHPLAMLGGELGGDPGRLGVLDPFRKLTPPFGGGQLFTLGSEFPLGGGIRPAQVIEPHTEVDEVLLGGGRFLPRGRGNGATGDRLLELGTQAVEKAHDGRPGRDRQISTLY